MFLFILIYKKLSVMMKRKYWHWFLSFVCQTRRNKSIINQTVVVCQMPCSKRLQCVEREKWTKFRCSLNSQNSDGWSKKKCLYQKMNLLFSQLNGFLNGSAFYHLSKLFSKHEVTKSKSSFCAIWYICRK